jgi:hypothetical protein
MFANIEDCDRGDDRPTPVFEAGEPLYTSLCLDSFCPTPWLLKNRDVVI